MSRLPLCIFKGGLRDCSSAKSLVVGHIIFGWVCCPAGLVEVDHRRVHVGVAGHRLHLRDAGPVANCRANRRVSQAVRGLILADDAGRAVGVLDQPSDGPS